ncbi:S24 family peptidase [Aliamphritea spongicola]|nr:S24 family peptidase [Aliamphritea spongicola]
MSDLIIDDPAATYLGYAEGESMVGDGIFSGDLLVISRAETVKDQDVVVANLNGVFVCKKIDKRRGFCFLLHLVINLIIFVRVIISRLKVL